MCFVQARLVPLSWARDFAPVYGSVMNFMAQRQQLYVQRRVDGLWYMPQQVPPGQASASLPALRSQTGAELWNPRFHETSAFTCVLGMSCTPELLCAVSAFSVSCRRLFIM